MSQSLPVIQSIPHGGLDVPEEIADRINIDTVRIQNECDLWVNDLFDFSHPDLADVVPAGHAPGTLASIQMDIARVLIDANRTPDSLNQPDGAVKSRTSYGEPIYDNLLSDELQQALLDRYWQTFHDELDGAVLKHGSKTRLFLDCHNMAQEGPAAYRDAGAQRPLVCLANFGDAQGEAVLGQPSPTCSPKLLRLAGEAAAEIFADLLLLEPDAAPPPVVALNHPFPGGYTLQKSSADLSRVADRPVPCILVELNRGLFIGRQSPDLPPPLPEPGRIRDLRRRLYRWVQQVVSLIDGDQI